MKQKLLSVLICLSILLIGCNQVLDDKNQNLKVTFIDVGQGDAILLECNGQNMLIDGGSAYTNNMYFTLKEKEINKLEYVFCSHFDEDHIGGLILTLPEIEVKKYYCPSSGKNTKTYNDFINVVEKKSGKLETPKKDDEFNLGEAKIKVLAVDTDPRGDNDSSMVLQVTFGNVKFLFTGDAEKLTIDYLLNNYSDLKCDVLKVAHHGAKDSSPKRFISATKPRYAVISVGANNRYNHPDEETTSILSELNIETFITSVNGTVIFETDGNNLTYSFK